MDYLVELNDLGRHVNTVEVKKLFHESLSEAIISNREAKALNETLKAEEKLNLGRFTVDPKYTDFIGKLKVENLKKLIWGFSITKTTISYGWIC